MLLPIVSFSGAILIVSVLLGAEVSAMREDLIDPQQGTSLRRSTFVEGVIASIDVQSFTVTGLPGLTAVVNSQTRYQTADGIPMKGLRDLFANDRVRIHGYKIDMRRFVATQIQVESGEDNPSVPSTCLRCLTRV